MSLADELQKLEELRASGALTDEEFQKAKTLLLDNPPAEPNQELEGYMADHLAEVRHHNTLAQIDREWELERERYMISGRYGRRYVPTTGMGIGMAVLGGAFGIFWTILAITITGSGLDLAGFNIAKVVFPLLGVFITATAIAFGIRIYSRAQKYQQAYQTYQERRTQAENRSE